MKKYSEYDKHRPHRNLLRTAAVNLARPDSWCVYADGFRRAAELLIEHVNGMYEINTVIFPILALYRQYVELSLKEIIDYGRYLDRHEMKQGGHDLSKLWAVAKPYVRKHHSQFSKARLKRIEEIIRELHKLDPTSERSRYPFVKVAAVKGRPAPSFVYDADPIILEDLAERISELGQSFKEITDYLSACRDFEIDFQG